MLNKFVFRRLDPKSVSRHSFSVSPHFIAIHHAETHKLIDFSFDPYSHQPSYKADSVRIARVEETNG